EMQLESTTVTVNKSAEDLYHFLLDVKNFEQLMPENISKFEVIRNNAFVFALKGMPEIALELKEFTPHSKIILGAVSDKLPFTLTALIDEVSIHQSTVSMNFNGEFNAMMAMMIKGPITKF